MQERRRAAAVLASAGLVLLAACGASRTTSIPEAVAADAPTTLGLAADPGRSRQLEAITTPNTRGGVTTVVPAAGLPDVEGLTAELVDRLGGEVRFVSIEVGTSGAEWEVVGASGDGGSLFVDTWEWREPFDPGDDPFTRSEDPNPTDEVVFTLDDVSLTAPGEIEDDVRRRIRGLTYTSATLLVDDEWGLHWDLTFSGTGAYASVVAGPDGDVWAVDG